MKTPSHWFRDRWLYDLVVIERRGMADVAAKFGMTGSQLTDRIKTILATTAKEWNLSAPDVGRS